MSNNCLVTKLKGVVNNNNLLKLGEILLEASSQPCTYFIRFDSDNCILRNVGTIDIQYSVNRSDYTLAVGNEIIINNISGDLYLSLPSNSKVGVFSKCNITKIQGSANVGNDIQNFEYLTMLKYLFWFKGDDIQYLANIPLITINLQMGEYSHVSEGLVGSKNSLTALTLFTTNTTPVISLQELGSFISLSTIAAPGSQLSGSIEEFVAAKRLHTSSGSCVFQYANEISLATFQNKTIDTYMSEQFPGKTTLIISWDASSITPSAQ